MKLRTEETPLQGLQGIVSHSAPVLLAGSCFADNIGAELQADLFDACVNPFGPLYNPLSLLQGIGMLARDVRVDPASLIESEGRWHSWDFHSRLSAETPEAAAEAMNRAIADGHRCLKEASAIIITYGTTGVWRLSGDGRTVANCHKAPQSMFTHSSLALNDCITAISATCKIIGNINPAAAIILTVSPLRYTGDGLHDNTIIKATLQLAVEHVCRANAHAIYFPAYEIMMDDLRDYRFYADDLKHPSQMAVKYIYELFCASFFTPATLRLAADGRCISRRLAHRPFRAGGETPAPQQVPAALMKGYNRLIDNGN